MTAPPARRDRERGAGTVLTLVVLALMAVFGWAGLTVACYAIADHRAQAAADLAALAGARAAADRAGDAEACLTATGIAQAQGAGLTECEIVAFGGFAAAQVTVAYPVALPAPGFPDQVSATARAANTNEAPA
jgi:secretion/DNA translocation related TadE-like protein